MTDSKFIVRINFLNEKLNAAITSAWQNAVKDATFCRKGELSKQEMLENITVYYCKDCTQVNFDIDLMPEKGECQIWEYVRIIKKQFPEMKKYNVSFDSNSGITVRCMIIFSV